VLGSKCAKSETVVRWEWRAPHDPAGGDSLPVSIPTLRRWIRTGELGAHLTPGGHRRIDLPEFQRSLRAQGRPAFPAAPEPKTRVLVVEDEALVVQMLRDLLADGPFAIDTAADGYEALVKVGTFRPSLIILDVVLAGLDGIEACRCLRRLPETREVRILGVTGHPSMVPVRLGAGADACVTKPLGTRCAERSPG
jgi:excisionase family DNA binding protein